MMSICDIHKGISLEISFNLFLFYRTIAFLKLEVEQLYKSNTIHKMEQINNTLPDNPSIPSKRRLTSSKQYCRKCDDTKKKLNMRSFFKKAIYDSNTGKHLNWCII